MGKERIVYQNWIVDLGYDPALYPQGRRSETLGYNRQIVEAVNSAMMNLTAEELDFIRAFYMQGLSYREISEKTGRVIHRLELVHSRAVRKLKKELSRSLYSFDSKLNNATISCPLCAHPQADRINTLILSKEKEETWKRIIRELKERFAIRITTPKQLIGHRKYHI